MSVCSLIVILVVQGIRIAQRSNESGAGATVILLGCIGCCLFLFAVVTVILIEMKLVDRYSMTWSEMFIPIWILNGIFGCATLFSLLQFIGVEAHDSDVQSPGLWSSFVCWSLGFVAIVITEILACRTLMFF